MTHAEVNGLYNLGTGLARSWNNLARAISAAMGRPPQIDYIDMPEALHHSYQYFTQASMDRLKKTNCPLQFRSLEEAARDYVLNYLDTGNPYL